MIIDQEAVDGALIKIEKANEYLKKYPKITCICNDLD